MKTTYYPMATKTHWFLAKKLLRKLKADKKSIENDLITSLGLADKSKRFQGIVIKIFMGMFLVDLIFAFYALLT
jgi:hypothetical protein